MKTNIKLISLSISILFLACSMSCNPLDTPPGMSDIEPIDCDEYLEREYPEITHEGKGTVAASKSDSGRILE